MVGRLKERNTRHNPYVSLCIDHGYQYVTLSGNVNLIDDPEIAQHDIYQLAYRYEGKDSDLQQTWERFSKEQRVTPHLARLISTD